MDQQHVSRQISWQITRQKVEYLRHKFQHNHLINQVEYFL